MDGAAHQGANAGEHTADALGAWTAWMRNLAQAQQQAYTAVASLAKDAASREPPPTGAPAFPFPLAASALTFPPQFAAPPATPWWSPSQSLPQIPAETLQTLQEQYLNDCAQLAQAGLREDSAQAFHALHSRLLRQLADVVEADAKTRARIRFAVDQWVAASAPGNFMAFNLEAQRKAVETQGRSIAQGLRNLLHDVSQGQVSMTDGSQFEVGRNLAMSEGAVVYENDLFQLIEYKPLTVQVYARPLLLVPPCINKFYILDLQPANSLIRYAVSQGHRVFVVSWRNPAADPAGAESSGLSHKTWDDYVEQAVIRAIQVTGEIAAPKEDGKINALGFCVGGTLLGTALAVLAARGEKPVASLTLLTTFLDFSDTGVLDVFIDEASVCLREQQYAQGGLLPGRELAATFSFLRPAELVWNYVALNYLKGETPPPFDLLYWNGDSTNLPGPWYAWYLRNTYLENNLVKPGRLTVCGESLDLRRIDIPAYIYGSREDHIVPVGSAYANTQVLSGPRRFVMGASGHIAGVINPPEKKRRSYWVADDAAGDGRFPARLDDWLSRAREQPGSWWSDWSAWLATHAGPLLAAPKKYGKGSTYKVIEPAPGRYVKQRV